MKTLTITSTKMGEGKTTVSLNLAKSMAEAGIKTLYIDADLRKASTLHELQGDSKVGLTNLLSDDIPLYDAIQPGGIEHFYFIASGPKAPNPAELVESRMFHALLETLSESFDMVIIDTPPLGAMIDAAVIASHTDGTLLVVGVNETYSKSLRQVKEQLEKANARILGVVLNKVDKKDYQDYYGYYNYHYDSERPGKKRWWKRLGKIMKIHL